VCSPTGCCQHPNNAAAQSKLFTYVGRGGGGDNSITKDSITMAIKFFIYTNHCQAATKPKASLFMVKYLYYYFKSLY
jgi:hypothetical protein